MGKGQTYFLHIRLMPASTFVCTQRYRIAPEFNPGKLASLGAVSDQDLDSLLTQVGA